MKRIVFMFALLPMLLCASCGVGQGDKDNISMNKHYNEIEHLSPNIGEGVNELKGIVLHHTAEPTAEASLNILCSVEKQVSCHVMIDTDGTRYIVAPITAIAWHAGYSILNGREKCNEFTLGIEFQGNTLEAPLTDDQIASAIEFILPIMEKYHIPIENIVTHEQIRNDWMALHPDIVAEKGIPAKQDITKEEYKRFIEVLKKTHPHTPPFREGSE